MIDYRTEIPFQKLAPSGFHDTSEEIVASKNQKFDPVMLHKLEAERRYVPLPVQRIFLRIFTHPPCLPLAISCNLSLNVCTASMCLQRSRGG